MEQAQARNLGVIFWQFSLPHLPHAKDQFWSISSSHDLLLSIAYKLVLHTSLFILHYVARNVLYRYRLDQVQLSSGFQWIKSKVLSEDLKAPTLLSCRTGPRP